MRTIDLTVGSDSAFADDAGGAVRASRRFPYVGGWLDLLFQDRDADVATDLRTWMLKQFDELDPATHLEASVAFNAVLMQTLGRDCLIAALNNPADVALGADAAQASAALLCELGKMLDVLQALQERAPPPPPRPARRPSKRADA